MQKITIKKRGKLFKLSNGETIRTPRIIYRPESDLYEITAIFRKLNLKENTDFLIETISDEDVPQKKDTPQKFSRPKSGGPSVNLNNIIEHR